MYTRLKMLMKKTILLFLLPLLVACGHSNNQSIKQSTTDTVTDDYGRTVVINGHASRIVSASPSITEILYALGQSHRLVGRTDFCVYPPDADTLTSIGGISNLNIEAILALHPDLVLTASMIPQRSVDQLEQMGVPVVCIIEKNHFEDLYGNIRQIGGLIHCEAAADSLITLLQQRVKDEFRISNFEKDSNSEFKIQNSKLNYPLFVKPAAGGSSVATTKVKSPDALMPAIQAAFEQDDQVLVEECIKGREFDCGVFRKADGEKLVFPITEIIPKGGHEFFDYEAKYEGFSNEVTPAECDERISKHIQTVSSQLYDLLGCCGIVRFDYIYDTDADELYFLEVNTIPGQSAESIVPKQARAMGISPTELYEMAIEAALEL